MEELKVTETTLELGKRQTVEEYSRTYHYPDGSKVDIRGVFEVIVRTSGTHRVRSKGIAGVVLHIIQPGWNHIAITTKTDDWSF